MKKATPDRGGKSPRKLMSKDAAHGARPSALPLPRPGIPRSLPPKSVQKASNAFRNFSLSRFPKGTQPKNFVRPGQAKNVSATQTLQKQLMAEQVSSAAPSASQGTIIGLTQADMKSLFSTYDQKAGTIPMADVLSVLRQKLAGTEFYTRGAPPLVQSAQQARIRTQVQSIIQTITSGTKITTKGTK